MIQSQMWRRCLASAFRTSFACAIVAGVTLYGPALINRQVAFPAFSYVTVMLILTDATLGHTLRCCWLAVYATFQGVLPAILSLSIIGPGRLTISTTAGVVAVSAFVVALPEKTHVTTKRIALGQIVLVYVIAFINGESTEAVMHPVRLAASTALGVVACVLALAFPYPSLAFCEVKENCRLFIGNACERLNLFVKSFSAEEITSSNALISQAKSLKIIGRKLLSSIKSKEESMLWEILPIKIFKSLDTNPGQRLQDLETVLGGMEIALTNCAEFPIRILNSELKNEMKIMEEKVLNQVKSTTLGKTIHPQSDSEMEPQFLQTLQANNIPLTRKDLPSLFFMFCLKLIQTKSSPVSPNSSAKQVLNESHKKQTDWGSNFSIEINKRRLMPALKCSLSLGFAILFGLLYSKENGFWAGLPVAISFASSREATFRAANVKAQGTVLGTVYGIIGCFLFEKYVKIRFISLLPWFIFCSFLRQSRMYGQAGGISAIIGALLILGRKNFGTPSEFAIARIVETFIGLTSSIMVDILLHPTRASVLAKLHLSMSLQSLHDSVGSITLYSSSKSKLQESERKLKSHVNQLRKFIEEAEVEPNFWFLPFHGTCYNKLMGSLSKMVEFLQFGNRALSFIEQESRNVDGKMWKEAVVLLESDLKLFKDPILCRTKCFEGISMVKSVELLEREFEKRKNSVDLEMGKSGSQNSTQWSKSDDDEIEKSTNSFLQHLEEILSVVDGEEQDVEELKIRTILSLSTLIFCMNGLLREIKEIEEEMRELVQWENPSSNVNLHDISCKIHALGKNFKD